MTLCSATKLGALRTHWLWEAFYEAPWSSLPGKWREKAGRCLGKGFFFSSLTYDAHGLCANTWEFSFTSEREVFSVCFLHKMAGWGLRLVYSLHPSRFFSRFLYPYFVGIFFVKSKSFFSCGRMMSFWMFPERVDLMGLWENTCHRNFLIRPEVVEDRPGTVFHQGNIYS